MSDRQTQKNELRQQDRTQYFIDLGYSPQVAERMAINFPLAFQGADKLRSGSVVNQDQLNELWKNFKTGDLEGGAQSMSFDQYLNDPRAAVRRENGQYVWRPEQMQGDFLGVNRESFLDTVMGSPIGTVLLPAAGGAALNYAGLMNGATPSGFLGDVATTAGGLGEAAGVGALNSFDTGAMGQILGTGATDGAGVAGGIEALNSFDTGAMAKVLGTDLTTAEKAMAAVKSVMATPGGTTAQVLSNAIKGATGLDVSPGVLGTIGKIAAVGLAASGGGNSGSGISSTAAAQGSAATDALGLAKEQWAWNKARADEIWPQTKALVDQQLKTAQINADRSQSEWDTYKQLYLPAEQQYVDKMSNWDTADRRTQRVQEAVADVNRGYDSARGTMERGLERVGVKPGGAGFTQAMGDLSRAQAADTAGATNNARRAVENEGIAGLERVTNIGRGRPSTSFAADQLALQAGNSANANANQNTVATNAGLSSAQGWFNSGVNALNSQGNMQNTAYQNQTNNSVGIGKLLGQLFSGGFADGGLVRRGRRGVTPGYADGGLVRRAETKLRKHLGPAMNMRMSGYAEGGLVRGPGTGTSDSIPAVIDGEEPTALSTGEAVLNAEAVNLVGPEFVERINQAGLQRRQQGGGNVIEGEARRVM